MKSLFNELGLEIKNLESIENGDRFDIRVVVRPQAKQESLVIQEGYLKANINEGAFEGRANARLIKILSKKLGISQGQVEIIGGKTSRDKRVRLVFLYSANKNRESFIEKIRKNLL